MQQGIKKLQWFEYLKVVFLKILNPLLCRVFANQVTIIMYHNHEILYHDIIVYLDYRAITILHTCLCFYMISATDIHLVSCG